MPQGSAQTLSDLHPAGFDSTGPTWGGLARISTWPFGFLAI